MQKKLNFFSWFQIHVGLTIEKKEYLQSSFIIVFVAFFSNLYLHRNARDKDTNARINCTQTKNNIHNAADNHIITAYPCSGDNRYMARQRC